MLIEEVALQYGLAGLVLVMLYSLLKNGIKENSRQIKELANKLEENTKALIMLSEKIETLIRLIDEKGKK